MPRVGFKEEFSRRKEDDETQKRKQLIQNEQYNLIRIDKQSEDKKKPENKKSK